MKAKLQNLSLKAALAGVLGSLVLTAGLCAAALIPMSANAASNAAQTSSDWTHLGGDPLFPGGLTKIAHDQHISLRQALVYAVTSSRGQTAMIYAGLDAAERHAVNTAVRTGNFGSCQLKYGMSFERMSFGINGTSVDRNVTFRDSRFRNQPASAFCVNAKAEGAVVHLLIPVICVNVAVINRTVAPTPKPKPAPRPKAKPGTVNIWIRKQAFSAASEEQLINPTPTNVFRFKVQCGPKGKPRYIVYQSDPQYAGTCKTTSGRVLIWELSTLGPDKWQNLSPVYQTFKLKGKKKVLAVYKDKQVKQPVAPPPTTTSPPPTTTSPPPTTTVVTTTTSAPPPEIKTLTQIQELFPNETDPNVCADVRNVPSGGATIEFSVQAGTAPKGSFVSGASQTVSSGNSSVCATFQAPATTGTNQYFATLKVGGKQVDQASMWVEIISPPSNPG